MSDRAMTVRHVGAGTGVIEITGDLTAVSEDQAERLRRAGAALAGFAAADATLAFAW